MATDSLHLDFLRKLQKILDEGQFTATYKYALLLSLADLSIEQEPEADGSLRVSVDQIAEKFIRYYWRQVAPYVGSDRLLWQSTGRQAAVVNRVREVREVYHASYADLRNDPGLWRATLSSVRDTVIEQPLWKLQLVGGQAVELFYRQLECRKEQRRVRELSLFPTAVQALRDLHPIVSSYVRSEWVRQVQQNKRNQELLGARYGLEEFLFGQDRQSLAVPARILAAYQGNKCFYCETRVRKGVVDHFVPWSRYPYDLGHNLVFAHEGCNARKKDHLAAFDHLRKWISSNIENAEPLTARFEESHVIHDRKRSRLVARWAYTHNSSIGMRVWLSGRELVDLDRRWRPLLERTYCDH